MGYAKRARRWESIHDERIPLPREAAVEPIMQRALSDAIALAAVAHGGALDKSGQPYITHPIRVMMRCERHGPLAQMIAVLHDTVEDTWVTLELLRTMAFPPEVIEAVDALSRRKG